jgi:hypothetical protein
MQLSDELDGGMGIHNRYLPRWIHRIFNAVFGAALFVGAGALGLGSLRAGTWSWELSWWAVRFAPVVALILLFVNPERFSVVNGVAGETGYDELRPPSNQRLQRTWPAGLPRRKCVTISHRGPRR